MSEDRRVRFVLVRPRNPNNIGACARALVNFGFDELLAVDPYEPVWKEARAAVGAEDVLLKARAVPLDEALEGCDLVLGTTSLKARVPKLPVIRLPALAPWTGTLAVLFGSEKTGLTNDVLSRCDSLLTIPTAKKQPSMNLSQAVAVVAYQLSQLR
jgi:tRNA/rRNA methyltransferase